MKYVHIKIEELREEKGISKEKICKALNLQRGNLNKYCRDGFKRIDANLLIKLCDFFDCEISDLLEIKDKPEAAPQPEAGILYPIRRKRTNHTDSEEN